MLLQIPVQIFIEICYDIGENMSYIKLPLYRDSSSNTKVFRLCTINIYVMSNSCTNFHKNMFDRKKVINFFQLHLCFVPLCIDAAGIFKVCSDAKE